MTAAISKNNYSLIYRHPFTISEIFACEVSQINDLFFTAPPPPRDPVSPLKQLIED